MQDSSYGLDLESFSVFLNAPTTEPLFPNLHHLPGNCAFNNMNTHLLRMPFPSLVPLFIQFWGIEDRDALEGSPWVVSQVLPKYQETLRSHVEAL